MKSKFLLDTVAVPIIIGGLLTLGVAIEVANLAVNPTTTEVTVTSALVKQGKAPKYLVTLSNGVVVEVEDLFTRGQFESALLFGQFQAVAGKDCLVTVSYAGVDNNILSIHPFIIESGTDLTCK